MIDSSTETKAIHAGGSERGFTLIETSIAIAVLLIGLVSIVGISVNVSRANSISNIQNILATAAQEQVDTLRAARWSSTTEDPRLTIGGSIANGASITNHFLTRTHTPAGDLIVRWQVTDGPHAVGASTGDVRTVTIRVVQVAPARGLADGFTVTTIINRN